MTKTPATAKLFTPINIGPIAFRHRVVMAPLTRSRSDEPGEVPGALMLKYYAQRASVGGLIISEATNISMSGRGWYGAPGLFTDAQVAGWEKITHAIHDKGAFMFAQLWHTGRSSNVELTGGAAPVSASVNPSYWQDDSHLVSAPTGWIKSSPHRSLETHEVADIVQDYRKAAARAKAAGFDGVELHAGNGYLPDQFLQDGSNKRSDRYGGSVEKSRALSPRDRRGIGVCLGWRPRRSSHCAWRIVERDA